jgi:hypothetical protein
LPEKHELIVIVNQDLRSDALLSALRALQARDFLDGRRRIVDD